MKIKALEPWYGCKRTLAPQIVQHFGEHSVYWELCCGSMAMLFAKVPSRQETVIDLHDDALNLARVVRNRRLSQELDWVLRRTLVHEGLYRESIAWLKDPAHAIHPGMAEEQQVERAAWYFVRSWMGMNGVAGTRTRVNFAKRYTSGGGCPAVRFGSAVDSIPDWHERLRNVAIYQGCAIDAAQKIEDKPGTLIYADPPYIEKSDKYEHDFTEEDHSRLATALNRFTMTRVCVSYYAHPTLELLYPGNRWRTIELSANRAMGNASRAEKTRAPEILLINDL
jgi:DNA adenine methylase